MALGKMAGGGVASRDVLNPELWSYTDFPEEMAATPLAKLLVSDEDKLCGW